ncbi:MAG: substrate-binding domain-containing protein [Pirellulaceae bacterium]|nr:substrate-binding domain-containing protein [Pirellulaceae bacterium]
MLPRKRGKQIALAFPTAIPYMALLMRGVADYARQRGDWTLIVEPGVDGPFPEKLAMSLRSLHDWPGDGVIGIVTSPEEVQEAKKLGIPMVTFAGTLRDCEIPRVMVDHRAIGRLAAEHLLERGLRRFMYFGVKEVWYSDLRRDGFAERIAAAGGELQVRETVRRIDPYTSWQAGLQEMDMWLREIVPPAGIFAVHDYRARVLVDECRRVGLAVPDDVAIIGVDNNDVICEFCRPPLSSVSRSGYRVGYEAAALLDRLMAGKTPPDADLLIPPEGVVARKSTDLIAIDNPHVAAAMRYIQEHLHEPFGVERLVKILPVSRRRLENLFQKNLGRTPLDYLSVMRINRAKELLASPEKLAIGQIAKRCGFSNPQSFRMVFTRLVGKAPMAYRNELPPIE